MNLSRLIVLGLLSSEGPMHGHKIRRMAEMTNVETWGGVNVGALYRELHRMKEEGLVEPVRSEQMGARPARTVYEITDQGAQELVRLRDAAWRSEDGYLDPVGVALLFGGKPIPGELAAQMKFRRQMLSAHLESLTAERERYTPQLSMAAIAVYRRGEMRLAAELSWHDELERILLEETEELPAGERHKENHPDTP